MDSSASSEELARKAAKPNASVEIVQQVCQHQFGSVITSPVSVKRLESYDDDNYFVQSEVDASGESQRLLIKFYNGVDSVKNLSLLQAYGELLATLSRHQDEIGVEVPSPMGSLHFIDDCPTTQQGATSRVAVRAFRWIDGDTLNTVGATDNLLEQVGGALGKIAHVIKQTGFDHPAFHRVFAWDLRQLPSCLPFVMHVDDAAVVECIHRVVDEFSSSLLPDSDGFQMSVLMGDANDANIIVRDRAVVGLIDFGDATYSWTVNDLAVAICYALLSPYGEQHAVNVFSSIAYGYLSNFTLSSLELKHLKTLIAARLSISISIGAYSISKDPTNEYLKLHAMPARRALMYLWSLDSEMLFNLFIDVQTAACAHPAESAAAALGSINDKYRASLSN